MGLVAPEAFAKEIVIKGVTAFPKNHLNNDPVQMFIDKVNKRTAGTVRIEWVGGPEVIKTFDQVQALKMGMIDMLLYYPFGYMKPLMPESWCKGLSELAEWEERKTGAFDLWSEIIEKRINSKYLGRFHSLLPFTMFVNKDVKNLADFKGLKIRVMPLYIPFVKALGAAPVTIPPSEIYTSLERGVVDGFMWPDVGMVSFGLQEVTKYSMTPGVFQMEPATMMNMKKWKQIPTDAQEAIMEVMQDMEYIASMRNELLVEKEHRIRKAGGMQTIQLPPDQATEFRNIVYEKTWEFVIKEAPEYGPKLRTLTSRSSLKKGTFPWQD
jgi:TRAP-type C4-dicarboxylate transport system substrate-binding protein